MFEIPENSNAGWQEVPAVRHGAIEETAFLDRIAEECPVALVFNGISHAVMMTTPRDFATFAAGFALTEGIVKCIADIRDIDVVLHADSAEVQLTLAQEEFFALKAKRRSMAGRTGCGVCGIESIALLDLDPEPLPAAKRVPCVAPEAIRRATETLPAHQHLMRSTGGVHAAAWCDRDGHIACAFEDVGRHNALDKLIGHLALSRIAMDDGFVLLSSRASYELVRKAARVGIPMIATISAPTTLAVNIARRAGIKLTSFCRGDRFVDYTAGPNIPSERAPAAAPCGIA
jgi:FdhD protein